MKSIVLEAAVIGFLAGGWASSTYWPGELGVIVGITVGTFAWAALLVQREDQKEKQKKRNPKKGVIYGLHR